MHRDWHGTMTIFVLTTHKMQKAAGLRSDDLFLFLWITL